MTVISIGSPAPPVPGLDLAGGARALLFYKVTCPVCQLVAPLWERLDAAYPETVAGIGQDPKEKLGEFAGRYGWSFGSTAYLPPYDLSEAYGIRVVPTVVVVQDNTVAGLVESWDRDGYNDLSTQLASLTGRSYVPLSEKGGGLPSFRPG